MASAILIQMGRAFHISEGSALKPHAPAVRPPPPPSLLSGPADGAPLRSPDDSEPPEQLLVHLTVRGRGTLLAYSSHKPQVRGRGKVWCGWVDGIGGGTLMAACRTCVEHA